jgi:hypothetical protein
MLGHMHVSRKPTSDCRESNTAKCVKTSVLIFTEMFEGVARMATKKFVTEWGKLPVRALHRAVALHGPHCCLGRRLCVVACS